MICCSINKGGVKEILGILDKVEMAEVRLDLCQLSDEEVEAVFSSDTPLIATCRVAGEGCGVEFAGGQGIDWHYAERVLALAIKAGARYVDLEIEAPKPVSKRLAQACAEWGTTMVRSYHNFEETPSLEELKAVVDRCRHHDGDIVKIAVMARSEADVERVLNLYKYYTPESLVAFAMGPDGTESRLECLRRGAPWSYACVDEAVAPGQMKYEDMFKAVYGERKVLNTSDLRMPCSKSYAQRAIIAAALAEGTSILRGYTPCGDNESALRVAEALGAKVILREDALTVESAGASARLTKIFLGSREPLRRVTGSGGPQKIFGLRAKAPQCVSEINVGESGLLTRLMLPLCCLLRPEGVKVTGEGTLLTRSLDGADKVIAALGGELICENPNTLPMTVAGSLKGGRIEIDGSKTSQLISGALMALPMLERNSTISVKHPTSIPYIYMTMDILRKFGIKIRSEMYGGRQLLDQDWSKCTEMVLKVKENQAYKAAEIDIEGDWSAATAFMAAGAIFGKVVLDGLDTTSLQADLMMLDILMEAGASVSQMDEPKGTITVQKAPLQAFKADLTNSPDLFPVVSVFCAFCQGRSTLRGLHRLVHKESDRAEGIKEMLDKLGVRYQVKGDDLLIDGESLDSRIVNGRLLSGGKFSSHNDHRMVMALRLAELGTEHHTIEIDDTECVAKSYPEFNNVWNECIWKQIKG